MASVIGTGLQYKTPKVIYFAAAIASLSGLFFGYDLAVISGALLFIKKQFSLSPTLEEVVASSSLVGGLLGALLGGTLADFLGRKKVLILIAIISTLGSIGSALATNIFWIILGRTVGGVAMGMISVTMTLYISEISPAKSRGRLVTISTFAITFGILISYIVNYGFSKSGSWQWMFGLAAIPAFVQGICMLFLPESPRWLVKKGLTEKARSVLIYFRGTESIDEELNMIKESVFKQAAKWSELFGPNLRKPLVIGILLAIFRSLSGFSIVMAYAPTIFQLAGVKSTSVDLMATLGLGVVFNAVTILEIWLIDRVGRRPLLLIGLLVMGISLAIMGFVFYLPNRSDILGLIAVFCLFTYSIFYSIGPGSVIFLMISEIYPLNLRGVAMSIAMAFLWAVYIITTITFLTLIQYIGIAKTFWLYTLFCAASWFFSYFLIPETKGKSLEEIEKQWHSSKKT